MESTGGKRQMTCEHDQAGTSNSTLNCRPIWSAHLVREGVDDEAKCVPVPIDWRILEEEERQVRARHGA